MPNERTAPSAEVSALRARVAELEAAARGRQDAEAPPATGLAARGLAPTDTLVAVARALAEPLAAEEGLRRAAREVARALAADTAGVYVLDARRQALVPVAGYHVPAPLVAVLGRTPIPVDHVRDAWMTGRAVAVPDALTDPRIAGPLRDAIRPGAIVFAPALVRGEPVGGLALVWWRSGRAVSAAELTLVEGVASQVGLAAANIALTRQAHEKIEELSALHDLSRAVTGQLDTTQLVEAVHRGVERILDARNLVVLLHDPATGALDVALRLRDGAVDPGPPRRHPRGATLAGLVAARRTTLRTADYAAACRRAGIVPLSGPAPHPHWLAVPMVAGEAVLGVLVLGSPERAFTEADERLLTNIAGLAALALRSARLYEDRSAAYRELTLTQDRMVHTEKLRALGEMAAGVAHDFNNLLAVILGRSEILLRRAADPPVAHGLEMIRQAALDGAQTIRRIQEFTRRRRTRPFERIDLAEVLHAVVEMHAPRWKAEAQSRGVAYEVTVDAPDGVAVAGRPEELREVFANLLINALEAMPTGGGLRFRLGVDGDLARVAVSDTGVGMAAETARRAFEPFFTTKGPQGSGLGLSVVWGIVGRHGGTVEIDSRPGAGTTFTVRLPVSHVALAVAPAPAVAVPDAPRSILVVDDEPGVRAVLHELLAGEGYTVLEAPDARAALRCCETEPVDLLLSDVSMPDMSGWELADQCRARFPGLRVGLITGWGDQLDAEELARHRIRFVVGKPFQALEVLRRIVAALAEPRDR